MRHQHSPNRIRNRGGYTLVEMAVALLVFAVIAGAAFLVLTGSSRSKREGDHLAEAQQNARTAMNAIINDLREAGYGINPDESVPIEVASDFRLTLIVDKDGDGVVDDGDRITYFVDPNQSSGLPAGTENPYDYVLRRLTNSAADSFATPGPGKGDVVAYMITQRSSVSASSRDVPLFRYVDRSGSNLMGGGYDPDGTSYGYSLSDSCLGLPAGSVTTFPVARVVVNVVAETAAKESNDHKYRRYQLSSTVRPRNFSYDFAQNYKLINNGSGSPGDSSGSPGDTSGSPADSTDDQVLPPYEPPIRIATARVLSMSLTDLNENDTQEGSQTTVDGQGDPDIILGTKASASNNLSAWFDGQPGLYSENGGRLYRSNPNYFGNSSFDIQDIRMGTIAVGGNGKDAVVAVKVSDTTGGFQLWFNQTTYRGWLGSGYPTTSPNNYYSNGSGQGTAVALGDFNGDGDTDVLLGTITGSKLGRLEHWRNTGAGVFQQVDVYNPGGEVNDIAVFDYDHDGRPDCVVGINTHAQGRTGGFVVYHNTGNLSPRFSQAYSYTTGNVRALAVANLNNDSYLDIVVGTQDGNNTGKVEFWKGTSTGFVKADYVSADGPVLSLAVGPISYPDTDWDVVAGTEARSVQVWFTDPANGDNVLPSVESWADANAGGTVHAVSVAKVEAGSTGYDPLYDIVVGTAVSPTTGEIVIYLNPYVWTLQATP